MDSSRTTAPAFAASASLPVRCGRGVALRSGARPVRAARRRPGARVLACAEGAAAAATDAPAAGAEAGSTEGAYDPAGMTVEDFFRASLGTWKSQRSSHNLVWAQFEAVTSRIAITERGRGDGEVAALCADNDVAVGDVVLSIHMAWEGESDWDEDEVVSGAALMCVVEDAPGRGRLLRSAGYAETIPAVGEWTMRDDGTFVLLTPYESAAAEERIWFSTPDLRLRVSNIRTSSGRGVITASFSSEIRVKPAAD